MTTTDRAQRIEQIGQLHRIRLNLEHDARLIRLIIKGLSEREYRKRTTLSEAAGRMELALNDINDLVAVMRAYQQEADEAAAKQRAAAAGTATAPTRPVHQ